MKEVSSRMGILEGGESGKTFTFRVGLIDDAKYALGGILMQWSVAHGGPGLPVLSEPLYRFLFGLRSEHLLDHIDDIADDVAKDFIVKVRLFIYNF
jgi:hypothetical protein